MTAGSKAKARKIFSSTIPSVASFILASDLRCRRALFRFGAQMNGQPRAKTQDRIGMIDVIAQDTKTGEVVLRMDELDPWDGSDERLLALQERFNAYVSFLLDGEMASEHPELVGKPARIELRCAQMPNTRALELLGMIHDQLAFQEIKLEVIVAKHRCSCCSECAGN